MNGWTSRARVCLGALLLTAAGIMAVPATASAEGPLDVFTVRDLTQYPLIVTGVTVNEEVGAWSNAFGPSFPYPGQAIQPGHTQTIEMRDFYNGPAGSSIENEAFVDYTIGPGGPGIHVRLWNNGKGAPFFQDFFGCDSLSSDWTCHVPANSHAGDVYNPAANPNVTTEVGADRPTLQAQLLQALCQPDNPSVPCTFTPTGGAPHEVTVKGLHLGDDQYNYTNEQTRHAWIQGWESGTSMAIGGSYSPVDIDVEKVIKVEVKATFDHEWGTSTAEEITRGINIKSGDVGYIAAQYQAWQVSGNFRVGIGNQIWILTGMTFTTPVSKEKPGGPPGMVEFPWIPAGDTRTMSVYEKAHPPPMPPPTS